MKLSQNLEVASRYATNAAHEGFLLDCVKQAKTLEDHGLEDDVRDFHEKFDHPAPDGVMLPHGNNLLEFRIRLIEEEVGELIEAIRERSLASIAGEAVDVVYVVVGTLVALGVPFMPFWKAVHRANMGKEPNPEGGKPIKPEGWCPPRLGRLLYNLRRQA